jgi:hypothetical protein
VHQAVASALELLLPFRRRELRSGLSVSAALTAIADQVEPRRWLRWGRGSGAFEGTVTEQGFDVQRIISYRKSFLPKIRGEIRAQPQGSSVSITMTLSGSTLLFIPLWLVLATTAAFESATSGPSAPQAHGPVFVCAASFAFVWLMTCGVFAFEAKKAERLLTKIFKATRLPPPTASE